MNFGETRETLIEHIIDALSDHSRLSIPSFAELYPHIARVHPATFDIIFAGRAILAHILVTEAYALSPHLLGSVGEVRFQHPTRHLSPNILCVVG